jgi:predicted DNA-binding protein
VRRLPDLTFGASRTSAECAREQTMMDEEMEHYRFAVRDLAVLESG